MGISSRHLIGLVTAAGLLLPAIGAHASGEVNIYSARQEVLIRPLLDQFTEESGIEVNLLSAKAGELMNRLRNEGRNSPADVLLTVDAGNLHQAKQAGLFQSIESDTLDERVPEQYRDPDGDWYGLSLRARVIFRHRDRVAEGAIADYESLADEEWENRLCIRSSDNVYNQSLTASMIAHHGADEAQRWAEGVVASMARPPQGGDRDQLRAVVAGQCDIAVANTYYFGGMLTSEGDDRAVAEQLALVWPNQDGRGAHVNVSGAGVTAHAPNRDNAIRLIEFLTSESSQRWYAEANSEYPIREGVEAAEVLRQWGDFRADGLNLSELGEYNAEAVRLMDRAGWR